MSTSPGPSLSPAVALRPGRRGTRRAALLAALACAPLAPADPDAARLLRQHALAPHPLRRAATAVLSLLVSLGLWLLAAFALALPLALLAGGPGAALLAIFLVPYVGVGGWLVAALLRVLGLRSPRRILGLDLTLLAVGAWLILQTGAFNIC